ncbi:ESX secretion-associated protein EspG [Nocardia carnea]|uniref:ESX secretion-associated protein EspG n=1 Tax=Nocardia carnea TaxID=37328 RepID=UPI00245819C8|nr:ESX secretion-associated protein EspG [Nocardia carnea]
MTAAASEPGRTHDVFADVPGVARRWLFSDIEFKVLCDDFRRGKLPKPFTFTSRIRSADAYAVARDHARRTLAARSDPAFEELVGAISRPDVIVVARGWDERDPQAPDSCTYLHAVRQGSRGYVIRQRIGETIQHSSGFEVAECPVAELAAAVAGLLPAAAAGTRPEFTVESIAEPGADTTAADSRVFFDTPATGTGYLRVLQSRLHFRLPGTTQTSAVWRDLPGDGRYLIRSEGARSTVTGMDHRQLSGWIDGWIDTIVHRLDSGE